jgi:hypothetical protein
MLKCRTPVEGPAEVIACRAAVMAAAVIAAEK